MLRKYTVYLPWILGFTILFILSIVNGQWPPVRPTETITPITPDPIPTATTPGNIIPVVPTTLTPGPTSTTTTPLTTVPPGATTPPSPISTTTTPSTTVPPGAITITPEPDPISTTPSPNFDGGTPDSIDEQAAELAAAVVPKFEETYDIQFNSNGAQVYPARGSASDIDGMVVPVASETEKLYYDENGRALEVQGILSIEPPLYVEIMIVVEDAPIQYSRLQTGDYMVACTKATEAPPNQIPNCIAVSEEGVEFALRPDEELGLTYVPEVPDPTVQFIEGSVHACFTIRKRRICVRAFK
jgi:hypothetical protein